MLDQDSLLYSVAGDGLGCVSDDGSGTSVPGTYRIGNTVYDELS